MGVIRCRDCGLIVSGPSCTTCGWVVPAGYVVPARKVRSFRSSLRAWERVQLDRGCRAVQRGPADVRRWWDEVRRSRLGTSTAAIREIMAVCAQRGQEALDAKDRAQAIAWCRRTLTLGRGLAHLLTPEPSEEEEEEEGTDFGYRLTNHLPGEELCARIMTVFGPVARHPVLGADRAAQRFLRAQARCWGTFEEARRISSSFVEPWGRAHVCECEEGVLERIEALDRWVEILRGYVERGWLRADRALGPWLTLPPLPP
jgi:hypothetical protein